MKLYPENLNWNCGNTANLYLSIYLTPVYYLCSNYDIFLTRDCLAFSKVKPAVNQIETYPYFRRDSLVKFCQKHGIAVTAHTPLGGATANSEWFGTVSCLDGKIFRELAEKYNKTVAQFILRWGIQRNTTVIPKSSKPERLHENFEVFDFSISDEDMDRIKALDRKYRTNQPAKFWGGGGRSICLAHILGKLFVPCSGDGYLCLGGKKYLAYWKRRWHKLSPSLSLFVGDFLIEEMCFKHLTVSVDGFLKGAVNYIPKMDICNPTIFVSK
ncbi:NADP-dependent D-sorbitol-6-phosphate dehydrogenase [Platanthera zijinensis]|uniref:NADP-dependent D-sorbitol-6-phosphate dehydrogenase n=1 Tax=Platanthera zijinensis TaxID=2320716 RepID=A0AAP0G985_9ASPA